MNVENLRRSKNATLRFELAVSNETTLRQVEALRRRVAAFLIADPRNWRADTEKVRVVGVREQSLVLLLFVTSRHAWQNTPAIFKAVNKFILSLAEMLRLEGVRFRAADLRVTLEREGVAGAGGAGAEADASSAAGGGGGGGRGGGGSGGGGGARARY